MSLNKYFLEQDRDGDYKVLYIEEDGQKYFPGSKWDYKG